MFTTSTWLTYAKKDGKKENERNEGTEWKSFALVLKQATSNH